MQNSGVCRYIISEKETNGGEKKVMHDDTRGHAIVYPKKKGTRLKVLPKRGTDGR